MKNKIALMTLLIIGGLMPAVAQVGQNPQALEEFEEMISAQRNLFQALERGDIYLPFKIQQYDTAAVEVKPHLDPQAYKAAATDPFYGYQIFILIDKSISSQSSKVRSGNQRAPQTMHIYVREGNELKLRSVHAVSTGREPTPGVNDTREGFMRIQSAQAQYVSRKYGEAMPYSLWFESEYGTAIHETLQGRCDSLIGRRASAGCIRLCPGVAQDVFHLVKDPRYPRTSPIVLLDKRTGVPIAKGTDRQMSSPLGLPKVIQGYPVMVRIIDGQNQEKIQEIESIIQNPTKGFQKYFTPFASEALQQLSI